MTLNSDQLDRYARHIVLKEIGGQGQRKLLDAKALIVGAGGVGAPVVQYLAAAGVGEIGVVDDDAVTLSNLQRQTIHTMEDIGRPKTESARAFVEMLNPDVTATEHRVRLDASNVDALVAPYDIVIDGSDNFNTRFIVNDACLRAGKTLVSAALGRFDGQVATFKPAPSGDADGPCYRCLVTEEPPAGAAPACAEVGVLGAVAGVVGSLAAVEAIKEIAGLGDSLAGRLLIYDALGPTTRVVALPRDPGCPACGDGSSVAGDDIEDGADEEVQTDDAA